MTLSRRHLLAGIGTAALTGPALLSGMQSARAQDVNLVELYKAGPLGDKVLGSDSAPVTIVEYASVTCPHCATFHQKTYPALKSKYIDTGKVKLIFREFPTQPAAVATAGFMLARQAGFSQEKFDACLNDQKLAEQIQAVAQRGNEQFKVESTPTFFINGKKYVGALSMPELEKILEPLLKSS